MSLFCVFFNARYRKQSDNGRKGMILHYNLGRGTSVVFRLNTFNILQRQIQQLMAKCWL